MAVTVQMQFTSAVTEMYQDAFVGSSMENGTTIITFDLRKHDLHQELGTQARLSWRKEAYRVDVHELSTFHNPITYRFLLTQGAYLDAQNHVTVQVVKAGITPPLAPSEHVWAAETVQLHPARWLYTRR